MTDYFRPLLIELQLEFHVRPRNIIDAEPTLMLRPFKPLIHHGRQMREHYEKPKDRWDDADRSANAS